MESLFSKQIQHDETIKNMLLFQVEALFDSLSDSLKKEIIKVVGDSLLYLKNKS